MRFISLNNVIWFLYNLIKIRCKPFIIIWMPVFYMLNLVISYNYFIRYNIIRNTFVYFSVYFSDYMHVCYLFRNSCINYTRGDLICNCFPFFLFILKIGILTICSKKVLPK